MRISTPLSTPRRTATPALTAALLVFLSASGLLAGGLTSRVTGGLLLGARSSAPPPRLGAVLSHSPTPTTAAAALITRSFALSIVLAPDQLTAGATLYVTLVATDAATGAPVAALRCYLENPSDGSTPLLSRWPAATTTDARGRASWVIIVPRVSPGSYEIGYGASGSATNWYHGQRSVLVTG